MNLHFIPSTFGWSALERGEVRSRRTHHDRGVTSGRLCLNSAGARSDYDNPLERHHRL